MSRNRNHDRDPTNIIDALIVTGGVAAVLWVLVVVPYLRDVEPTSLERVFNLMPTVLALGLVFAIARLSLGVGRKFAAFVPLGATAVTAVVSEMLEVSEPAGTPLSSGMGAIALAFVGVAAAHPSMVELTRTTYEGIADMTPLRFTPFAIAAGTAPAILLYLIVADSGDQAELLGVLFAGLVSTILVLVRLYGLVQARDHVARVEGHVHHAIKELVSSTTTQESFVTFDSPSRITC